VASWGIGKFGLFLQKNTPFFGLFIQKNFILKKVEKCTFVANFP